jgi:ATP citrate (pro-S)-lyase
MKIFYTLNCNLNFTVDLPFQELGLIRKPASFMTSICDERGQELLYAGMPVTEVLKQNVGIGGVVSLLWFQRCLPALYCKFLEMSLMLTADHGPAVSGAHNTIVCARAGKDLVSSLVSGLLTIVRRSIYIMSTEFLINFNGIPFLAS